MVDLQKNGTRPIHTPPPQGRGTIDPALRTFNPFLGGKAGWSWVTERLETIRRQAPDLRQRHVSLIKDVLYLEDECQSVENTPNVIAELMRSLKGRPTDPEGKPIWEERAAAALMLGATRSKETLPHLVRALDIEEDIWAKQAIVLAIGKISPRDAPLEKFTGEIILQIHSIIWADEGERDMFLGFLTTFLDNPAYSSLHIQLDEHKIALLMQCLAVSQPDREGKDNWQVREAAARLLGVGHVWDGIPNLIRAAARDPNEEVRRCALSSVVRIGREYPPAAKKELDIILAPLPGETSDDLMAAKAKEALIGINAPERSQRGKKLAPSIVVVPFLENEQKMICLLRLAKGKGEATGSHNYFHQIVREMSLDEAIPLLLGGNCVKIEEENIPYLQDVVSKISVAAFKKQGTTAYGKVISLLASATARKAFDLREARKTAVNLNPDYLENTGQLPLLDGKDEERLVRLAADAFHSGDYSTLVAGTDPREVIKAVLFSSLVKMDDENLSIIARFISGVTREVILQKGTDAFHGIADELVSLYVKMDSPLYNVEQDIPTLIFAKRVLEVLADPNPDFGNYGK
ncbi:MAG: hypothetical protein NTY83_03015 [Candidatus Micrarchaeota archaeon]|nr:hypothetical protein [Candidatus Micrarchaeota archaeon]